MPKQLDVSVLAGLVGDDPVVIDEVLRAFHKGAAQSVQELRGAVRGASMQAVADASHKLKSSALTVGALRLGELCAQIERAAHTPSPSEVDALLPIFEAEVDAVQTLLESRWR